jgi:putative Mg2+ transporter-C (MgtC) family protein
VTTTALVLRVVLAAVLGGVLGLERELRGKAAGVRTNTLVAVGAALFMIVSIRLGQMEGGSVDRIAAQVVTGVGFLGGGAILRSSRSVHGMTTAATIWVNAAVGMAAGAGLFAEAVTTTVIALIVLAALPSVERWAERRVNLPTPPQHRPDR